MAENRVRALREKLSIQRLYQYQNEQPSTPSGSFTPLQTISENDKSREVSSAVRQRIAQLEGVAAVQKTSPTPANPSPPKVGALVARFDPRKEESPTKLKDESIPQAIIEEVITEEKKTKEPEVEVPAPSAHNPTVSSVPKVAVEEVTTKKTEEPEPKVPTPPPPILSPTRSSENAEKQTKTPDTRAPAVPAPETQTPSGSPEKKGKEPEATGPSFWSRFVKDERVPKVLVEEATTKEKEVKEPEPTVPAPLAPRPAVPTAPTVSSEISANQVKNPDKSVLPNPTQEAPASSGSPDKQGKEPEATAPSFWARFASKPTVPSVLPNKKEKPSKMAENEREGVTIRLADILRTPENLEKIPALKAEIMRKKAAVDAQLMEGLKEQLEATQSGMTALSDGQKTLNQIKEEMMNIDRLCREAKGMIQDGALPNLELIARTQRNFAAVEKMKNDLETFNDRLAEVEQLLSADDQDMENQPNLLPAHYELTKLRDIRDDAIDQIQRANDPSSEGTLQDYFSRLDEVIEWFDDHIGTTCMQLIPMVQADNRGLVVRLAVVVAEEEKSDLKVKALQDASKDHKELAERFKSINTGPKQIRGYKEKFLKCIEFYTKQQFEAAEEAFLDDPSKIEKSFKWFFNDLYVVKQGMQKLMPKKWKIFKTYSDIYHKTMHDWLITFIDDPELRPPVMLAIVHWIDKYYSKMKKLGWEESDLQPHVLDNREADLVGEWRQLIVKTVEEWMDRMYLSDRKAFLNRDANALDSDANGLFRTKTLGDMWRMLREQTVAAGDSERTDVTEGVIDAMFRALKYRQSSWEKMIDEETDKYKASGDAEGMQQLQDWLVAIANDQISCIDDNAGQLGYLTRFKRDFENLVTPKYLASAEIEVESIRNAYVDLSAYCITRFVFLIFNVDLRTTIPDFFTQKWYPEYAMKRIITTFEDYIGDYYAIMYPSLLDIFYTELADELLVRYLSSVRNKGAKFRRTDPFQDKFREDISTVFDFFMKAPDSFPEVKMRWRVVDYLVRLLESEKAAIVGVYEDFKSSHWDLQLGWVEAVLKSRDDSDRATVNAVKARAAEMYVDRREETVMSKVR